MPIDYSKYPDNWKDISARIRFERAQGKCEQCGAPHGEYILRSAVDAAQYVIVEGDWYVWPDGSAVGHLPEEYAANSKLTRVILTVHHIGVDYPDGTPGDPRDKMDVRDENLIAYCQRCHLLADLPHHIENARQTRRAIKEAALREVGQERLL